MDKKINHLSLEEMNRIVDNVEKTRQESGLSEEEILNEVYDSSKLNEDATEELQELIDKIADELQKDETPSELPRYEIIDMTTQPRKVQKAYKRALEKAQHTMNVINNLKNKIKIERKKLPNGKPDVKFVDMYYNISKQIAEMEFNMAKSFEPFRVRVDNKDEETNQ